MRAWSVTQHGEPLDAIAVTEKARPEPAPGEVQIEVDAVALGLPDVFMCRGSYVFRPELPFTPGQEVSGTVTAVGEGASTAVGARVMAVTSFFRGHGGFAEYALALDGATHPAPANMDAAEAACFAIPHHTAYLGLVTRGQMAAGENLVVLGAAGGSGSAAISLGRALGARVIAVVGGSEKAEVCRALGADITIDHQSEGIAEAVLRATEGRGADLVYDPVGGDAFDQAVDCIASEGRILAIGYASGEWHDASTLKLVSKNASVVGVFVGAYAKPFLSEVHDELLALWSQGALANLVAREIDFNGIGDGLEAIATRRANRKLVARLSPPPP